MGVKCFAVCAIAYILIVIVSRGPWPRQNLAHVDVHSKADLVNGRIRLLLLYYISCKLLPLDVSCKLPPLADSRSNVMRRRLPPSLSIDSATNTAFSLFLSSGTW